MALSTRKMLAAAICVLAVSPKAAPAEDADARLEVCSKQHLEERFLLRPLEATRLGDHRFDALLDDVSTKARVGWLAQERHRLKQSPILQKAIQLRYQQNRALKRMRRRQIKRPKPTKY